MGITVRYAEANDLEQVNHLRRQVNDVHVNGRPDIFRPGFCEEMQRHLVDQFEREGADVLVACQGDEVCAFAVVQYVTKPLSPYNLERRFYQVEEFGVDEAHRRQGVATALVEFMRQDAIDRGFDRIELDMWEFNQGALKFYESVGFSTYRRYMELSLDGTESF